MHEPSHVLSMTLFARPSLYQLFIWDSCSFTKSKFRSDFYFSPIDTDKHVFFYISRDVYVVVQFYPWFKIFFSFVLVMVI